LITLLPEQCRAARALLDWSQRELARKSNVSQKTIAELERGKTIPWARTVIDLHRAFENAGVKFLEEVEGIDGAGVRLKWGAKVSRDGTAMREATSSGDTDGLNALPWDWEAEAAELDEDNEPLPPLDWTDEDRADQIEHWRSRPEVWARLHEVSRQCLLRAMGVDSLNAGDSAP